MLYTIIWGTLFCLGMVLTSIPLAMYYLAKLILPTKKADKFSYIFTRFWARSTVLLTGSRVTVIGKENLTPRQDVCYICNHQGLFDIPLLMGWVGRPVGFIGKTELRKFPFLSDWMIAIHSVFLDRSNARKAVESINKAAETIRNGHAIAIFPEGTRSKTGAIGDFKSGSFKLSFNAGAVIQPITVHGTRSIFEASRNIHKSKLTMVIHPAIMPDDSIYADKPALIQHVRDVITRSYSEIESGIR